MNDRETELDPDEREEEFVLPPESTFAVARWLKWMGVLFAPLLAAAFAWGAWEIVQERAAGTGWDNFWLFAFILATLAGLVLLFLFALAWILRARLTLNHQGIVLRGIFATRTIPWEKVEGYRLSNRQLFAYPADDRWPMNLSHFENQGLLYAWLCHHLPDLQAMELAQEADEIRSDHELGLSEEQKAARLGGLWRIVRGINWVAYLAAAAGGLNALFFDQPVVQLVAASALTAAPVALVLLALRYPKHVRLDYKEGSQYPEGLTGILASSLALGLMSLLDHHNTLGDRFHQWTLAIAAAGAGIWLYLEWERIRAQRRSLLILLHVLSILFLSSFWAGGSVYQTNKNADVSETVWGSTKVTGMRKTREKTGTTYHIEVAPWSASPTEPIELNVSGETYESLEIGAAVEIGVRSGALEIPWVQEVRVKRRSN